MKIADLAVLSLLQCATPAIWPALHFCTDAEEGTIRIFS